MPDAPVPDFCLVWREGGGSPVVKHGSHHDAEAEANRLAIANPGETFFVLIPISEHVAASIRVTHFTLALPIPF